MKGDIKLVLIAFNHLPPFVTIKDSQYIGFKSLQLGVYAKLTVSPEVLLVVEDCLCFSQPGTCVFTCTSS